MYLRNWYKRKRSPLCSLQKKKKKWLDITAGIRKIFPTVRTPKHQDKPSEMTLLSDQNMICQDPLQPSWWFFDTLSIEEPRFPPPPGSTPSHGTNAEQPGNWKNNRTVKLFLPIFRYKQAPLLCISLPPAKVSQKTIKLAMHSATYGELYPYQSCYLQCLFHFQSTGLFLPKPRVFVPPVHLLSAKLLLQKSFVAEASAPSWESTGPPGSPCPPESTTHVQTTGIPDMRGRDKWQKRWLMVSLQSRRKSQSKHCILKNGMRPR